MARVVVADFRVQEIRYGDGSRAWTIVCPQGRVHVEADRFLRRHEGSGTQRTYAYLLVDHLRWLDRECLPLDAVGLRDLERYMGLVGAEVRVPLGQPWREGKRPYGRAALSTAAACLKGFYLHQASLGVAGELGALLGRTRLPSRADRRRAFLGHVKAVVPANPLAPRGPHRRHPKMLPEGARDRLLGEVRTARDRLVVTWLADGGFRIGELCGLHLVDLQVRAMLLEAAHRQHGSASAAGTLIRGRGHRKQKRHPDSLPRAASPATTALRALGLTPDADAVDGGAAVSRPGRTDPVGDRA